MDFYPFDEEYLRRLRAGEEEVQEHFSLYFAGRLRMKLRARAGRHNATDIDDIIHETLLRALETLRDDAVRKAESFGAFVFRICQHVCQEYDRHKRKFEPLPPDFPERQQSADNPEIDLIEAELKRAIWRVIQKMKEQDRQLLIAFFFEERSRDEICQTFGVTRDYFRVCLHRAKKALKRRFLEKYDHLVKSKTTKKDN